MKVKSCAKNTWNNFKVKLFLLLCGKKKKPQVVELNKPDLLFFLEEVT